jgi:ABC-type multidrug transport system permease subunit
MVVMIFLGVMFGLLYLQIDDSDLGGVVSKISVMYMGGAFCGVMHASAALPVLVRDRAVFYREQSSHTYASWLYALALILAETIYVFFFCLLFVVPLYFLVGLENTASAFWGFFLAFYLLSLIMQNTGLLFANLCPNGVVAEQAQGALISFFFLFAGVFIQSTLSYGDIGVRSQSRFVTCACSSL